MSPLKTSERGFVTLFALALALALSLTLSSCESDKPERPAAEEKPRTKSVFEISEKPAWTVNVTGKRYCPQYVNNSIVDGGMSDVTLRDAATGKAKWSFKGDKISCPLVTNEAVYAAIAEGDVVSLDPLTGKQKQVFSVTLFDPDGNAPIETPGRLHFQFAGSIHAVDKSLKNRLWKYKEEADMWVHKASGYGTTLVLATQNGRVKAISAKDSTLLWTYTTPSYGIIDGGITVTKEAVYLGSRDGSVYALDMITGKKIWSTKLDSGGVWMPYVSGNLVITADEEYIHGLDKKTGKKKWRHYASGHGQFLTAHSRVFYTDADTDEVKVLDPATGELTTSVSPAPGPYWLAASPTHLYIWTTSTIQAHKVTTRASA
ncbi:PQQ-binding-like beta-propeller repeat protein [Streptomyces lavendofoliae]|uniref:PQQ-binding-like beta-propeller repeat protein n=1 Tax=Streptomyces lavendofoliae TaxID=67314 RepID=UPI003D9221D7